MNSWISAERKKSNVGYFYSEPRVFLDDSFESIENVPGLKTQLYTHQKKVVHAMIDAEMKREMVISNRHTEFNIGFLSEPVGSGKTVDILATILANKIPRILPSTILLPLGGGVSNILRATYDRFIPCTLIFVGASVLNQWIEAINKFTDLKVFVVKGVRDLDKLFPMIASESIHSYDIVLIKNGTVSRPVVVPSSLQCIPLDRNATGGQKIYNLMVELNTIQWARIVIDDYDMIGIPMRGKLIPAMFTWCVSSTNKKFTGERIGNHQFTNTAEMIISGSHRWNTVVKHRIMVNFTIGNKPEFIRTAANIYNPTYYVCVFKNPNGVYIRGLGVLGKEGRAIMEMLNGGAHAEAASRLGINSSSAADIFRKVLGDKFDTYKKSKKIVEFVENNMSRAIELVATGRKPMAGDHFTIRNIAALELPEYKYPNLIQKFETALKNHKDVLESVGSEIQRIQERVADGECPICMDELKNDSTIIYKCCYAITCNNCCNRGVFKYGTSGSCFYCRANLTRFDVIFLNVGFDLESIISGDCIEADEANEADGDESDGKEKNNGEDDGEEKKSKARTKIDAIIDIIKGIHPGEAKQINVDIKNIMKGDAKLPEAKINKTLVFAEFGETLRKIESRIPNDIYFERLHGTTNNLAEQCETFRTSQVPMVLTVNSQKHCSGVNLQAATALVYAHKIMNVHVEEQVLGRVIRLGREYSCKVYWILYQNEFDLMNGLNQIIR